MESTMTPGENFIVAIITQAIEDSAYTGLSEEKLVFKKEAIEWIVGNDPEYVNYCKMVALDPESIRNKIINYVNMSFTQKQKFVIKNPKKKNKRKKA